MPPFSTGTVVTMTITETSPTTGPAIALQIGNQIVQFAYGGDDPHGLFAGNDDPHALFAGNDDPHGHFSGRDDSEGAFSG